MERLRVASKTHRVLALGVMLAFAIAMMGLLPAASFAAVSAVAITSPATNDVLIGTSTSITGNAIDSAGVAAVSVRIQRASDSRFWDGANWVVAETWLPATGTTNWSYAWTFDPASQDGSPAYTIDASSTGLLGNVTTAPQVTNVVVDNTPPTAAITSPANNDVLTGSSKLLTGTSSDGFGVAYVEVSIQRGSDNKYWDDGTSTWVDGETWLLATGTTDWTYNWPFDPASQDGTPTYTIGARATDPQSNTGTAPSVTGVTVDNVGPTTTITSPASSDVLKGTSKSITGTSVDLGSGVSLVELTIQRDSDGSYWDGNGWVVSQSWLAATGTDNWSFNWAFDPTTQDGVPAYTIIARGTDNAANIGPDSTAVTGVTIDTIGPTTVINSPVSSAVLTGTSTEVTGTASDAGSGVTAVDVTIQRSSDGFYWNGATWVVAQAWLPATGTTAWSYSWTFDPASQDGAPSYTIIARGTDGAANTGESTAVTNVTIDNVGPVVVITSPASSAVLHGASTNVTGTASDGGGVNLVELTIQRSSDSFYWDGATWAAAKTWLSATGTTAWSYSWTYDPASQSGTPSYEIIARGVDNAGNQGADSASVTGVTIDNRTFTITSSAGANGTIAPLGAQVVDARANQTFTFTPSAHYHVSTVALNGGSAEATSATSYTFTDVTADGSIDVQFAIDTFTLTYTAGANGTISGTSPQTVNYNQSGTAVTAVPASGYHFMSWSDGVTTATRTDSAVTANINVTASFASDVKPVNRIGGATRYDVTRSTAEAAYPGWVGVKHVVLASGEDRAQPDALTAAGLAGVLDAPLMLVPYSGVNDAIKSAVSAMPAGVQVHIVGGTSSVSTNVERQLRGFGNVASVDRTAGSNRYATASAVARRMKTELVAQGKTLPNTTLITNGNFATAMFDALTASAISAHNFFPVLLVKDNSVPGETASALKDLGLTQRYIIGGTTSVKPAVQSALGVSAANRIAGATRYSTATAAATTAKSKGWLSNTLMGFAAKVPDAATGGAFMGKNDGALVYVTSTGVPGDTASYLTANKATITRGGMVFGGTTSVPENVRVQLQNLLK